MGTLFDRTRCQGLHRRNEVLARLSGDITTSNKFHEAVKDGNLDFLQAIHAETVDLNTPDSHGCTPLHSAAKENVDFVRALIAMGANMEVVDNSGSNPLHYAAMYGKVKCIWALRAVDVNAADKDGWTPLHHVALQGHVDCLEKLLTMSASVDVKDSNSYTPLHQAALYGNIKCVQKLIAWGADLNAVDNSGCTPLHHATSEGYLDCVIALFETRCKTKEKLVAKVIHQAKKFSEYPCSVIAEMARPQPDVFMVNCEGDRAIDCAEGVGHVEIFNFLQQREQFFR